MSFLTPTELAGAVRGEWERKPASDAPLSGIGIDSREPPAGGVFFAIAGERHDGHDHAAESARGGARLLVCERDMPAGELPEGTGVLRVGRTRAALLELAGFWRRALQRTRVVAVTGSAGKTTVKMLIHAVLSRIGTGTAAVRSFNNDVGVPLTLLAGRPEHDHLVVEIGANRPGEIETLAALVEPDVAVITMVGRAHLEGFGSVENVGREKAKLLEKLRPGGVSVMNVDTPLPASALTRLGSAVTFGMSPRADLRLTGWGRGERLWWFEVGGRRRYEIGLPGRHNAVNALAAIGVGRELGVPDDEIAAALAAAKPVSMRMTRHDFGDVVVYDDTYNANPESTLAALETFGELASKARRRILVLGEMRELGARGPAMHEEIGSQVRALERRMSVDSLVLVGPLAARTAAPLPGAWSPPKLTLVDELTPDAIQSITSLVEPGDVVLLKGSRALGLERLVPAIERSVALQPAPIR